MDNQYKFNGKELDVETGLYYYGARFYDPRFSFWFGVDPLAEVQPDKTPYHYCSNNPINRTDPTGMIDEDIDSTRVKKEQDGTYTVVGGDPYDGDNGIYLDNNGENGEKIGYSATPFSFYNTDANEFMGSINPGDKSGRVFLNKLLNMNLNELSYGMNATGGKTYDFKKTNGTNKILYNDSNLSDYFRGMPILDKVDGLPIYASARDVGNIAAGLVAGMNGNSWSASRNAFDALESFQKGYLTFETKGTVYAQRLGWNIGKALHEKLVLSRQPSNGHLRNTEPPRGYISLNFKQKK